MSSNIMKGSENSSNEFYDNYLRNTKIREKNKSKTFLSFYQEVMKLMKINSPLVQNTSLYEGIKSYFSKSNQIATSDGAKLTENDVIKLALAPLLKVNGVILEDTSNNIYCWDKPLSNEPPAKKKKKEKEEIDPNTRYFEVDSVGQDFHNICFSRLQDTSSRAGIVIRRPIDEEINRIPSSSTYSPPKVLTSYKKGEELIDSPLPSFRLMPWLTISFIELKSVEAAIDSNMKFHKQVFYYCESILRVSPNRKWIFACLSNFRTCKFLSVCRDQDNTFYYFLSGLILYDAVAEEISQFLISEPASLGFIDTFPFHIARPISVLGRGSTACVLACEDPTKRSHPSMTTYALKISFNENALSQEELIINYLSNQSNQLSKHLPSYQSDKAFIHGYRFFSKVYTPVNQLSREDIFKIWDILSLVHNIGIVHCDIRLQNIMKDDAEEIIIIDWSSSRPYPDGYISFEYNQDNQQLATFIGASDGAIESLIEFREKAVLYPADDAFALIMLTAENCFKSLENSPFQWITQPCYDLQDVQISRENCFDRLEDYFDNILKNTQLNDRIKAVAQTLNNLDSKRVPKFNEVTSYRSHIHSTVLNTINEIFNIYQEIN